jgi:hypothetical protein
LNDRSIPVAEKRLSIRLAALDGKKVEQTFRDVGESGERAFQRISQATKPASADLKAVDATARALNSVLRQAAGFIAAYAGIQGMVGAVRSIAERSLIHNQAVLCCPCKQGAKRLLFYLFAYPISHGKDKASVANVYVVPLSHTHQSLVFGTRAWLSKRVV